MGDAPAPQSWTIPGSAVLAVKLSTQGVSNCWVFFGGGQGWDLPILITWLPGRLDFYTITFTTH